MRTNYILFGAIATSLSQGLVIFPSTASIWTSTRSHLVVALTEAEVAASKADTSNVLDSHKQQELSAPLQWESSESNPDQALPSLERPKAEANSLFRFINDAVITAKLYLDSHHYLDLERGASQDQGTETVLESNNRCGTRQRLEKRRGGGGSSSGGGGGGGGRSGGSSSSGSSSSGSSSGSSSSGSRGGSTGSTGSSGSSGSGSRNTGSASSSTSGSRNFGGGRYYGGGSASPYSAGRRSPLGIAGFAILGGVAAAALIFPGIWLYGIYNYPYNNRYTFRNRTRNTNETLPVTCVCEMYSACGCDDSGDNSTLNDLIGSGEYSTLNKSAINVVSVNGTKTIVINGTLPNGTDTSDSSDTSGTSSSSGAVTGGSGTVMRDVRSLAQGLGWSVLFILVTAMVM